MGKIGNENATQPTTTRINHKAVAIFMIVIAALTVVWLFAHGLVVYYEYRGQTDGIAHLATIVRLISGVGELALMLLGFGLTMLQWLTARTYLAAAQASADAQPALGEIQPGSQTASLAVVEPTSEDQPVGDGQNDRRELILRGLSLKERFLYWRADSGSLLELALYLLSDDVIEYVPEPPDDGKNIADVLQEQQDRKAEELKEAMEKHTKDMKIIDLEQEDGTQAEPETGASSEEEDLQALGQAVQASMDTSQVGNIIATCEAGIGSEVRNIVDEDKSIDEDKSDQDQSAQSTLPWHSPLNPTAEEAGYLDELDTELSEEGRMLAQRQQAADSVTLRRLQESMRPAMEEAGCDALPQHPLVKAIKQIDQGAATSLAVPYVIDQRLRDLLEGIMLIAEQMASMDINSVDELIMQINASVEPLQQPDVIDQQEIHRELCELHNLRLEVHDDILEVQYNDSAELGDLSDAVGLDNLALKHRAIAHHLGLLPEELDYALDRANLHIAAVNTPEEVRALWYLAAASIDAQGLRRGYDAKQCLQSKMPNIVDFITPKPVPVSNPQIVDSRVIAFPASNGNEQVMAAGTGKLPGAATLGHIRLNHMGIGGSRASSSSSRSTRRS